MHVSLADDFYGFQHFQMCLNPILSDTDMRDMLQCVDKECYYSMVTKKGHVRLRNFKLRSSQAKRMQPWITQPRAENARDVTRLTAEHPF